MKAWQKGALLGLILGFRKVTASILFPFGGAIVGAILIQSIYLFVSTTKIKLWQKAGIAGAVWGLISGITGYFLLIIGMGHTPPQRIAEAETIYRILVLPGFIGMSLMDRLNDFSLILILPTIIGIFFGLVIYKFFRVLKKLFT